MACTRMIHGHTHRPARHQHAVDGTTRERFVLADWHDRGQYLAVDADGVHVREVGVDPAKGLTPNMSPA